MEHPYAKLKSEASEGRRANRLHSPIDRDELEPLGHFDSRGGVHIDSRERP